MEPGSENTYCILMIGLKSYEMINLDVLPPYFKILSGGYCWLLSFMIEYVTTNKAEKVCAST